MCTSTGNAIITGISNDIPHKCKIRHVFVWRIYSLSKCYLWWDSSKMQLVVHVACQRRVPLRFETAVPMGGSDLIHLKPCSGRWSKFPASPDQSISSIISDMEAYGMLRGPGHVGNTQCYKVQLNCLSEDLQPLDTPSSLQTCPCITSPCNFYLHPEGHFSDEVILDGHQRVYPADDLDLFVQYT